MNKEINQKAFTDAVVHLRKQGVQSLSIEGYNREPICLYRGPNGLKCAVGALIKDEFYEPTFEGKRADERVIWEAVEDSGYPDVDDGMLAMLQSIHDNVLPQEWETEFKRIAQEYELELPPRDQTDA